MAFAARALGVKATIVMPNTAPKVKLDATRALGAEVVLVGPASEDRIRKAEELEQERGLVPVPPYNDEKIIAGQGTGGLEILEDMPDVELVLVPIGGGGLISGIATAIKESNPKQRSLAWSRNLPPTRRPACVGQDTIHLWRERGPHRSGRPAFAKHRRDQF